MSTSLTFPTCNLGPRLSNLPVNDDRREHHKPLPASAILADMGITRQNANSCWGTSCLQSIPYSQPA
eukprot:6942742-Pyramimonas_sp.AAC.1